MKRLAALLLLAFLPALPGCMVVGAAVTAGGYVLGGPVQYASTAYSVCEYSYALVVEDKTPDEVIKDKIATVVDILDGPDYIGPWETGLDRKDSAPRTPVALAALSDSYGLNGLPDAAPEAPEAVPSPFESVLLADLAPAPVPAPAVQAVAPAPKPAPVQAAAGPARVPEAKPLPLPTLPDWPSLADAQAVPIPAQDTPWSVRMPVSNVII